jgi:hypothetical protein
VATKDTTKMSALEDKGMAPSEVENGCCACERGSCTNGIETVTSQSHIRIIRVFGVLTLFFSIIEFGVGGAVYSFLDNYNLGAFWVSLLALFAGFCATGSLNRGWVTGACVLASISIPIAFVASIRDGLSSPGFLLLSACASGHTSSTGVKLYGDKSDHMAAQMCLMGSGAAFVQHGCYCVTAGGSACGQYTLSSTTMSAKMDCGNVLTTYSSGLAASTAMCVLLLLLVLCLSIISCVILCCPSNPHFGKKRADDLYKDEGDIVGVAGSVQ